MLTATTRVSNKVKTYLKLIVVWNSLFWGQGKKPRTKERQIEIFMPVRNIQGVVHNPMSQAGASVPVPCWSTRQTDASDMGWRQAAGCKRHGMEAGCKRHGMEAGCKRHGVEAGCKRHGVEAGCKRHGVEAGCKRHGVEAGCKRHGVEAGCKQCGMVAGRKQATLSCNSKHFYYTTSTMSACTGKRLSNKQFHKVRQELNRK